MDELRIEKCFAEEYRQLVEHSPKEVVEHGYRSMLETIARLARPASPQK